MILHPISSKLANVFNKHCANPGAAAIEAEPIINEMYSSLGGCDLCFGKGYNIHMQFCECSRANSLKSFIKNMDTIPETHPPKKINVDQVET